MDCYGITPNVSLKTLFLNVDINQEDSAGVWSRWQQTLQLVNTSDSNSFQMSPCVYVKDGRGAGGNGQQFFIVANQNKTRPCNNNTGVTHTYKYIHIYNKTYENLYHRLKQTPQIDNNRPSN